MKGVTILWWFQRCLSIFSTKKQHVTLGVGGLHDPI